MANLDDENLKKDVAARREELLEKSSAFIGECREEVPFGEQFFVMSGGKQYISCTHKSPHTHVVV